MAIQIFRLDRPLYPVRRKTFDRFNPTDGFRRIQRLMVIDHRLDIRPDQIRHDRNSCDVIIETAIAELDLWAPASRIGMKLTDHPAIRA